MKTTRTFSSRLTSVRKELSVALAGFAIIIPSIAQEKNLSNKSGSGNTEGYKFIPVIELKATPVKNQSATGTCWCFATASFIESELIRLGKGEFDLSEMFIIRHNYIDRLRDNYLRRGRGNTGPGSLSHDWMRVFSDHGIVPEEVYRGLNYGSSIHDHGELQKFIDAVAPVPVKSGKESRQYREIVNSILDAYLGEMPDSFNFRGVTYTPVSFADSLGITPDDYVEITSFTHFPFYTTGVLEVPDNWSMARFYNVPLDELIEIMNYSFSKGYTVNWDGDVSESGFSHEKGYAVLPGPPGGNEPAAGRARVPDKNNQEATTGTAEGPVPEVKVTQELRQSGYETFTTTDDHLMHLTGIYKDQNGTTYYRTKNSWGTDRNPQGGYLNMSESYVRAKTLFIMVNKNGIPPPVRARLGL